MAAGCVFRAASSSNPRIGSANTAKTTGDPTPIVLGPDVRSAVIVGNEVYGKSRIVNHARGHGVIADNVEETDIDPYPTKSN